MTDKELKRLSRAELLELLLVQTKETERLREKLQKAESMLSDRYFRIREAGDIAHAALAVNGVMEAAQAAARQYLDNIEKMERETKEKCEKMLADARAQAERIRNQEEVPEEPAGPEDALLTELHTLLDDNKQ